MYGDLYPEQGQALVPCLEALHADGQAGARGGTVVPFPRGHMMRPEANQRDFQCPSQVR
jgi:hypothetical protein